MNDFWWIILLSLLSLIGGFILVGGGYFLMSKLHEKIILRKFPKDKKGVSELVNNPEKREYFENPGKPVIDEKEVKEDAARRNAKFREFEKLRRSAIQQGNNRGAGNGIEAVRGDEGITPRGNLPLQPTQEARRFEPSHREHGYAAASYKPNTNSPGPDIRSEPKKIRLYRPTDI